jgi:hypothetical protein
MSNIIDIAYDIPPTSLSGFGHRPHPENEQYRLFKIFRADAEDVEECLHYSTALVIADVLERKMNQSRSDLLCE